MPVDIAIKDPAQIADDVLLEEGAWTVIVGASDDDVDDDTEELAFASEDAGPTTFVRLDLPATADGFVAGLEEQDPNAVLLVGGIDAMPEPELRRIDAFRTRLVGATRVVLLMFPAQSASHKRRNRDPGVRL